MNERAGFGKGIDSGVVNILHQASKNEHHEEYSIYLNGDLCQLSAQASFLREYGVRVKFNNVYPCVRPCDKKRTFELIWEHKCDGWWHYDRIYAELDICDQEKFRATLNSWCEMKKNK